MNRSTWRRQIFVLSLVSLGWAVNLVAQDNPPGIPAALEPWQEWATWEDRDSNCPAVFNDAGDRICFWPTRLQLVADQQGGTWTIEISAFAETWVPLPGGTNHWPRNVIANETRQVVVERNGRPAVRLSEGQYELSGEFLWQTMPQKLSIPNEIGILNLEVNGEPVARPTWDASGDVWLQRSSNEETERDLVSVKVYRFIEDGIPLWLHTNIELTVSGKSREEELGNALPAGWQLATVESSLPVAIDEQGLARTQARPGKWTIKLHAFRTEDIDQVGFADDSQPIVDVELMGFQPDPDFRLAELTDLKPVDVAQTEFPQSWRGMSVFQWETDTPFGLTEKMRGMGMQRPEGLHLERHFWVDESGDGLTYRDRMLGQMQQIWRLDAAPSQQLGAVRIDEEPQLITTNPTTGDVGVEIRTRDLNLHAIGRVESIGTLNAVGWQTDVDSMQLTLDLPPGWRMLALFGADQVEGDWLTAWSLLDLFLLLVFGLAVARLLGLPAGVIAFLAFGLAYHEPGAPRLTWLFLLIPVALLTVVKEGKLHRWLQIWRGLAVALLVINLAPFLGFQIQSILYPQLERPGVNYQARPMLLPFNQPYESYPTASVDLAFENDDLETLPSISMEGAAEKSQPTPKFQSGNLMNDPKSRIQTGPAEPQWHWNQVACFWDGPVTEMQQIRPVMMSLNQNRAVSVVRILLLLLLAGILCGIRRLPFLPSGGKTAAVAAVLICFLAPAALEAQQIPSPQMLQQLRQRLLEPDEAFPDAATIPQVDLAIQGNRVSMSIEVHAAVQVAVPLPGRLPQWSPIAVTVDQQPAKLVCRREGFLWVVLPAGIHQVGVEAQLPDVAEWEWTFQLPPKQVSVDAPGWKITGIDANGVPEGQVFFVKQQTTSAGQAAYDRKNFNAVVVVDRYLETGLNWQVYNEVTRLSSAGRAVSVEVPLLPGERVVSSDVVVEDGRIQVKMGADEMTFSWLSEIPVGDTIQLQAVASDRWVEKWDLIASPIWNVNRDGLAPVFESQRESLVPVWHPWPGEAVTLEFEKPVAVDGSTATVRRVEYETALGRRQRNTEMTIDLECSLATDFQIQLQPNIDVSQVKTDGRRVPVRREGDTLIIPVQPGRPELQVNWTSELPMQSIVRRDPIVLSTEAANITSIVTVPESRWVLWADGPTRGPAVRFWVILIFAVLAATMLGSIKLSPLKRYEWVLLAIGLTQIHVIAALIVVVWLFLLAVRGRLDVASQGRWSFNLQQIGLVLLTAVSVGILVTVVGKGLLGNPDMFIVGNGSSRTYLKWFQPLGDTALPATTIVSISVWYYRLAMLFWALWLASALIRWLSHGWQQLTHGGGWKSRSANPTPSGPAQPEG